MTTHADAAATLLCMANEHFYTNGSSQILYQDASRHFCNLEFELSAKASLRSLNYSLGILHPTYQEAKELFNQHFA